ncbi:hypothetical protein EYS09_18885 [Streptomyces kasugaensis]|uniref:Uncharacterized protein n=1 Tax=Streptomyces kasugaensis TaxID=1946 RepID=A0A4Q9HSY6_STRKA|nr:hypothetical protein [Streptomyces kasugaensis]TBO58146.1 hypothetical protein EYS09_18885 [Streptomyces kasugaensis]
MITYPNPIVPAQPPAPAEAPPAPAPQPVPVPVAEADSTLRHLVIGLLIAVLLLLAAFAFYASLEHPALAAPLQAAGSVLGVVGTAASVAVLLGRRR